MKKREETRRNATYRRGAEKNPSDESRPPRDAAHMHVALRVRPALEDEVADPHFVPVAEVDAARGQVTLREIVQAGEGVAVTNHVFRYDCVHGPEEGNAEVGAWGVGEDCCWVLGCVC